MLIDQSIDCCPTTMNRLRQAQERLHTLLRQTAIDPDYVDPEVFCAELLDELQPPDDFFEAAQKAEPQLGLAWLLGALRAERCGDLVLANRRARQAISLDSHNLLAQRIHTLRPRRQTPSRASRGGSARNLSKTFCSAKKARSISVVQLGSRCQSETSMNNRRMRFGILRVRKRSGGPSMTAAIATAHACTARCFASYHARKVTVR